MNKMLQPTHDLIFLTRKIHKATGLIVVPENSSPDENIGVVVSVGPGKTYSNGDIIPVDVKVGDEVIYSRHAGQTFWHEGKRFIAVREPDIYAIISEV